MKKILTLAVAAMLFTGAAFACEGKEKECGKKAAKKEAKKSCCKKGAKKECSKEAAKETEKA